MPRPSQFDDRVPRPAQSSPQDRPVAGQTGPARPDGAGPMQITMSDAIGGPRGIVDSALPTVAFVMVNAEAGLTAGIVTAVVVAVVIFVLRIARREPKQQAFSGLLAVGVAAFVASRTGSAKDYFLPSILKNAASIAIGVGSLLVGRPLAGYVMAGLDPRYSRWRHDPDMRRAAWWATGVWIAVFALRFGIQGVLYLAGEEGWLAAANIALGLPLFGLAVVATVAIVRRIAPPARYGPKPGSARVAAAAASQASDTNRHQD
ncbi:MAG: DUF3159 domain-containing protein [Frankia sp.]|nr:DUF3159 domain-containing protein [Frankia sp.]